MSGDRGAQMRKGHVDASRGANAATGQGPKLGVHRVTGGVTGRWLVVGGYLVVTWWDGNWSGM